MSGNKFSSILEGDAGHLPERLGGGPEYLKMKHSNALKLMKRMVDIVASIFFFIAFSWLYILLSLGVLLTSGAPIFYSQKRCGKNGKLFKFYKFRSMIKNSAAVLENHLEENPNAKQQWTDFQKLENDPRITRFGSFIRRTSLDELPQFWNVLKGDMSLIGPRPCMVNQRELYGAHWAHYCAVRPGLTGLWQVSGRNKLNYKQRVALDVQYVETLSVHRDISIFVRTAWVVLTGHGSQ